MSKSTPDLPFDRPPEPPVPSGSFAVPSPWALAEGEQPFPPRVVRASAGSGKTFDLVGRYIGLLAAGVDPDKILATTFTRKAAGEILARVLLRLSRCVTDLAVLEEVKEKSIPRGIPFDAARAASLLATLCRELPRLQVETLDAFFHRIAKGHAFELELPPDWAIGDRATLARIRRRAVHDLLESRPESAAELMRRLQRGEVRRSVAEQIDALVVDLHHRWLESPSAAWDTITPPPAPAASDLVLARRTLAGLAVPKTKKGAENATWSKAKNAILRAIDAEDHRALAKNGLVEKVLEGSAEYAKKPIDFEWERALEPHLEAARHHELTRLVEQNLASLELISEYDGWERKRRDTLGIYDFQTVTRLLGEASFTAEMLPVYERIDARIDHILLDEFQDTSLIQYAVLQPILEELLAGLGEQRTFYCVGDVKQAIYGWRGGRRALFDAVEGLLEGDCTETKSMSWRSSPVILDAVNQVFEQIETAFDEPGDADAAAEWRAAFPPHQAAKKDLPGYVTLEIATATSEEEHLPGRELPYSRAIEAIEAIHDRDPRLTIGVLLRKNDRVGPLIDLLREKEIDASQEGGNPLTDSAAVNRILAALQWADHPADRAAQFTAASCRLGPTLGLALDTDLTTKALAARQLRWALIEEGYGATILRLAEALAPSCNARERIRLDQLVELAHRFGDETGLRPSTFVERVRKTPVESPTGSSVQVMTVHRSKGLEFDVVILPQLTDSWFSPTPTLLASSCNPMLPADRITRYASKATRRLCAEQLEPIYQSHRAEIVTEAISLFYVAMTRARHALRLWLPPGKLNRTPTFARIARICLGGEKSELDEKDEETVLYSSGDPEWIDRWLEGRPELERPAAPEDTPAFEDPPASEGAAAPVGAPPAKKGRAHPSELQHPSETSATPPSGTAGGGAATARRRAMRTGTTVHALLEGIEWIAPIAAAGSILIDRARRSRAMATLPIELTPFVEAACEQIEAAFGHGAARALYSEEGARERLAALAGETPERIEAAREVPYGWIEPGVSGSLMAGIIDRLHLAFGRDEGGREHVIAAEVIDAKTSPLEGAELSEHLRREYAGQLAAYAKSVSMLYGIPPERISTSILALPAGAVIPIPLGQSAPGPL